MKTKFIVLLTTLALSAMLFAIASAGTGAYYSDSKAGALAGDLGSIKVTTSGGAIGVDDGLNFSWDNILPGEKYTASANFQNTGDNVQDVWLVFDKATALSAFNSMGTYGAAKVEANGTTLFYSNNLNDHPVDQGDVSKMLPAKIKLASNVGPTASGSMTFTWQLASKAKTQYPGMAFNVWPIETPGTPAGNWWLHPAGDPAEWPGDGTQAGYGQNRVYPADGSGTGLPFKIVATQPGVEPGNLGTSAGF